MDTSIANLVAVCSVTAGVILLAALHARIRGYRDPQRFFSWSQKQVLLWHAGMQCEHKPILGRRCRVSQRLEADHIVPWSRGGVTEIANGQILCRLHNRRKSNLIPGILYRTRLRRMRDRAFRRHARHHRLSPRSF